MGREAHVRGHEAESADQDGELMPWKRWIYLGLVCHDFCAMRGHAEGVA
jgi:hypothetical protein